MKTTKTVVLDYQKECKHSVVFGTKDAKAFVSGVYIMKHSLPAGAAPKSIKLTLES